MTIPKVPVSFPSFVKYPLQAVTYVLLAYFIYKEFTKKDECADLRAINTTLNKRVSTLEDKNDNLTWAIAVKSGVIEQLKTQKDSLAKDTAHENIK
jgi:cell division protein FtsB